MYSDNYRGYHPQGRRPYRGRRGYDNRNYQDNQYYDDPPYNVQEYQPRFHGDPSRGHYHSGGRPYQRSRGGGGGFYRNRGDGSGFYRNDRGRYNRGGYQRREDDYYRPNYRGGGRHNNRGWRGGWQPREQRGRWQRDGPLPEENPPTGFHTETQDRLPDGLFWCCDLEGHTSNVNCLDFDDDAGKLFSGGADGIVRQWNAETGEIEHSASYNGEITALKVECGYLFVAVHCTQEEAGNQAIRSGDIHIYNLEAQSEQKFVGHMGRILTLHTAADVLLSAGEDRVIKGWKFNQETKIFDAAGNFGTSQGHMAPIQCLTTLSSFLFSGDANGAIIVWNIIDGTMLQTLHRGHQSGVTSMLCWKGSLITGSLDRTIRVWNLNLVQNSQNVVQTPPCYHSEAKNARGYPSEVVSLFGAPDGNDSPILIAGLGTNEIVLYKLPSFSIRGRIASVPYPRCLTGSGRGCIIAGCSNGLVRIFNWEEVTLNESLMLT